MALYSIMYIFFYVLSRKEGETEFVRKFNNSCESWEMDDRRMEEKEEGREEGFTDRKRRGGEGKKFSSGRRRVGGKIEEKIKKNEEEG
jgi:hypothetical protein